MMRPDAFAKYSTNFHFRRFAESHREIREARAIKRVASANFPRERNRKNRERVARRILKNESVRRVLDVFDSEEVRVEPSDAVAPHL